MSTDTPEQLQPANFPYSFAKRHRVLVREISPENAVVVCLADTPATALLEAQRYLGVPLRFEEVSESEFHQLLQKQFAQHSGQASEVVATLGEDLDLNDIASHLPEPEDLLESADEAPIIRLINALLTEAVKEDASDIHIEPYEDRLVVRFRVDGVLREILEPQRALAPMLISRIKVMAKLDIAEKRLPQDGRISLRVGGRAVDVRVSTLPSGHGERVVLRLLDKQAGRLDLKQLGMKPGELEVMSGLIRKPHGILLVTGPTGSGKTTTLYAILAQLNERSRNILTVEDPIEYYLDGIGQTQINTRIDMGFARGLRAILRQDPDVVMVGEIRDTETAQIAVQASLTGHLVLSTLHTNTAIGAVTRLKDMGVEPFLLTSSMIGVVAQRLVRILCPECKSPYQADAAERAMLGVEEGGNPITLYHATGCPACNQQGYRGRTGIFELVAMNERLYHCINVGASEQELEQEARTHFPGIRQSAREKVLAGETTLEEMIRVTREE